LAQAVAAGSSHLDRTFCSSRRCRQQLAMKRCRALVPFEVIEHKGYYYSTLDCIAPDQPISTTQTTYLPLREGWEIAPDEPDIVAAVVKKHCWAAVCVTFANGKSYRTKGNSEAGQVREQDGQLMQGKSLGIPGFKAKPGGGDNRVLIRTLVQNNTTPGSAGDTCALNAWKRRRFTDYNIVCEDEEIPCHREVLASCSPVFDRALDPHRYKEGCSNRYELKGSKVAVVKSMVEFMYTGSLPESSADLVELLCLADQYQVEDLVQRCAKLLIEQICPQNVVALTRAVKGFKSQPNFVPLWKEIQKMIKGDDQLLELVMDYL